MATLAAPPRGQSAERRFYSGMAIFLALVVLAGFGPSFYLRGVVPAFPRPNPTLPPSVIFHGIVFTAWMALLIVQTRLISTRRHFLHMQIGLLGMGLAILMIPVMYLAAVWQVERANQPPFTTPLEWTIVPLAVIPPFAFLIWQAWRRRRQAQWHKRLILCSAVIVVYGPAFGRLPLAPPTLSGLAFQMLAGMLILLAPLFLWDLRSLGRIHPATWTGLAANVFALVVPLALMTAGGWEGVARFLPGI